MKTLAALLFLLNAQLQAATLPTISVTSFGDALEAHRARGFSGVVLVRRDGETVYESAAGPRDGTNPDAGAIATSDRLLIGSITKQFVAACVLLLEERGKLTIEDKLSDSLPEYPWADRVTLAQLLGHTAGVPNFTDLVAVRDLIAKPTTAQDIAAIFREKPLDFEPGSAWSYSNSGYFLAGQVIEKVTGLSWFEFLRQEILDPLGLQDTGYEDQYSAPHGLQGFDWDRDYELRRTKTRYLSWANAAGALYSTANDQSRWNEALHGGLFMGGTLLKPESYEKMVRPGLGSYGLGLGHGKAVYGDIEVPILGHSGGLPGFSAQNYVHPKQALEIVVLSNSTNGESKLLTKTLRKLAVTGEASVTPIPSKVDSSQAFREEIQGWYAFQSFPLRARIFAEEDRLYLHAEGQDESGTLLRVIGPDLLYLRYDDITVEIVRGEDGKVGGFKLNQLGTSYDARKEPG